MGAFAPGLLGFAYAPNIVTSAACLLAVRGHGGPHGGGKPHRARLFSALLAHRIGLCAALATSLGATALALVTLAGTTGAVVSMISLSLLGAQYGMTSALLPLATQEVSGKDWFATAYGRIFSSWVGWRVCGGPLPVKPSTTRRVELAQLRGIAPGCDNRCCRLDVYHRRHRTGADAAPRSRPVPPRTDARDWRRVRCAGGREAPNRRPPETDRYRSIKWHVVHRARREKRFQSTGELNNSLTAESMNSMSVSLTPPPAKCPQTPGISRSSASTMWLTAEASSSAGSRGPCARA